MHMRIILYIFPHLHTELTFLSSCNLRHAHQLADFEKVVMRITIHLISTCKFLQEFRGLWFQILNIFREISITKSFKHLHVGATAGLAVEGDKEAYIMFRTQGHQ